MTTGTSLWQLTPSRSSMKPNRQHKVWREQKLKGLQWRPLLLGNLPMWRGEQVLKCSLKAPRSLTTQEILEWVHTLRTQVMREMEGIRELDRTLAWTLLAESARAQLIIREDLAQSLITLCTDLEASSEMLLSDLAKTLDLQPNNPTSCQVHVILQRYQQTTSLKVNLSLMALQAARDDMEVFLRSRLQEISSQTESRDLMEELARKLSAHTSRVQKLVMVPELVEEKVSLRVVVGLATDQPLEANFLPSLLEGVVGRLSLGPPGVPDPPALAKARVSRQWAATLREGIIKSAGSDTSLEQFAHVTWPPGLHLDYDIDFRTRRFKDIPLSLMTPLPSGPEGDTHQPEGPEIPEKPGSWKSEGVCGVVAGP